MGEAAFVLYLTFCTQKGLYLKVSKGRLLFAITSLSLPKIDSTDMGRERLSTRERRVKIRSRQRISTIKRLTARPLLKNVDVEAIATEFEKKNKASTNQEEPQTTSKTTAQVVTKATPQVVTKATPKASSKTTAQKNSKQKAPAVAKDTP